MKKRFTTIIVLILISLSMVSLIGCSDEGDADTAKVDSVSKDEKEDKVGTRSNPIDLGEDIEWKVKFYDDIDSWNALEG